MTPKVFNLRKSRQFSEPVVKVDRTTKWGNPFVLGRDGSRSEVIDKHIQWIAGQPELLKAVQEELGSKNLACWCSPSRCHADHLLFLANR